jgi:peptide/nickel transport system permease protein
MLRFVAGRVGWSVVVMLLASALLFGTVRATTDPLSGARSAVGTADVDPAAITPMLAEEAHRLHLGRPLVAQYVLWLKDFVRGDWGESITTHASVDAEIRLRLWNTSQLVVWVIGLSVSLAVVIALASATRFSSVDHATSTLSFVALSIPQFWFALMAIEILVFRLPQALHFSHPLLYSVGIRSVAGAGPLDYIQHLVLPVITISVPLAAAWSRYLRASMLDVLSAPFIRTARARGASEARVVLCHALPNALLSFTTVSALGIGQLFGGLIVTETIFAWPGMGRLLFEALLAGDTNVVLPWLMVAASFVLVLNLAAEVLNGVLDPRTRS